MAVSICFFTVIKHVPRHRGSKVDPNKKKNPSRSVLYTLLIHQIVTFRERYVFYDDRGHQTHLPVFYFQTALRHSVYVPPLVNLIGWFALRMDVFTVAISV